MAQYEENDETAQGGLKMYDVIKQFTRCIIFVSWIFSVLVSIVAMRGFMDLRGDLAKQGYVVTRVQAPKIPPAIKMELDRLDAADKENLHLANNE